MRHPRCAKVVLEGGELHLCDRRVAHRGGIVHQDIEPPARGGDCLDELRETLVLCHV
jgi:hypothetical protein